MGMILALPGDRYRSPSEDGLFRKGRILGMANRDRTCVQCHAAFFFLSSAAFLMISSATFFGTWR